MFVMENVKGMLSSSVNDGRIFEKVLNDLRQAGRRGGYVLIALGGRGRKQSELIPSEPTPNDFIVRSEDFGLPQARHRVIVLGMRKDIFRDMEHGLVD
jgi:DNA (cytosine-5)-methyltransferase 1